MNVIYLGYLVQFARLLKRSEVVTELAIGYESDLQRGREFKEVSSTFDELFFDATSINENPEVKKKFLKADLIVVAAFSQIISQELIDCANGKIINFHPSLLPSYRGGNPIEWQILNGVRKGGVTFHYLDTRVDSGQIIAQRSFEITADMDYEDVLKEALKVGVEILKSLIAQPIRDWPNIEADAVGSYHPRVAELDCVVNSQTSMTDVSKLIRALGWRDWVKYDDDSGLITLKRLVTESIAKNNNVRWIQCRDGQLKVEFREYE